MRLWNYAKTALQVNCQKNYELTGTESGLVAHYNFNQGTAGGANTGETTLNDLTSDGVVPNANTVTFKAGTSILLEPEFEVQLGATFDAIIEGCVPFAPPSPPVGEKQ